MKTKTPSIGITLRIVTILFVGLLATDLLVAQTWYDDNWQYRSPVSVTNPTGSTLTDYQVQIILNSGNFDFTRAKDDGTDVRVTDSDGTTLIPFWIESTWHATGDTLWVKVPSIPTSGTTLYVYYGNESPTVPVFDPVETPPAGPFTKNPTKIIPRNIPVERTGLLAENIVYDDVTAQYWMVLTDQTSGVTGNPTVCLIKSTDPTNPNAWYWHNAVITQAIAPHIIKHNGVWYIFYGDRAHGGPPYPIAVASSPNVGGPYTYIGPVLNAGAAGTWEDYRVDEPCVFQRSSDGKWIMLYMADSGGNVEQVGYATADNILGPYTKYAGNPFIPFGPSGSFDAGTVADPWIYEFDGVYYIGYTVSPTTASPWQTALATTTDWTSITKHGIILPLGGEYYSFRGAVTRIGDQYLFSYTGGASGGAYRLSLATQPVWQAPPTPIDNGDAVFDFFDGFDEGANVSTTKWTYASGATSQTIVGGGYLKMNSTATYVRLNGNASFGMDCMAETRGRHPNQGTVDRIMEVGFADANWNTVRLFDDFPNTTYWQRQAKRSTDPDDKINMGQTSDKNWHIFRTYRESPNLAGFQVDGNPAEEVAATTVPTMYLPPFLMSYGNPNQFIVDWTRVRKWAGANAVTTVGTAEWQCSNDGQWTGVLSTDWNNPANWCGNAVPGPTTDVYIRSGGYQPVIGGAAYCNNITLNSGATLTISGTNTLTVRGDWTNNGGTLAAGTGTVIFAGSAQTISGTATTFSNLTLSSTESTTLGVITSVAGNLSITSGILDLGTYTCNRTVAGGTLTITDGARLKIGGTGTLPSNYSTHSIEPSSIIEYSGTDQIVAALNTSQTYGHLTLSGSGYKTFPDVREISGTLSISGPDGTVHAVLEENTNSSASALVLGGQGQTTGTWGSSSSPAGSINNLYFAGSGTVTISTSLTNGTWLGGTSADWNDVSNWNGRVSPPSSGTNVIIPEYASYQPVISALPAAVCNHLTINVGASLAVNAGQALTVNGDLTNSGTLEIFSGYNEGTLTSSGSLIVKSNSTGNVTYHRQLRPKSVDGDYHYFASPVSGNTVLNADKVTTVWRYNEVNGLWPTLAMTALESGRGYNLAQTAGSDGVITFRGSLVTSDIIIDATSPYGDVINGSEPDYDDRHYAGESVEYPIGHSEEERSLANYGGGGWNMLGNPYTSALLVSDFIAANTPPVTTVSQFDPNYVAVYLYDGNTAEHNVYYYIGNPTGWGAGTTQTHVQAGQGFFVLAMNDYSSFTFNRGMQEHSTGALMLKSAGKSDRWPGLQLKIKSGSNENLTTVVFNDEMTAGLDPGYDVGLMSSGPGAGIYTALVNDNGINFTRQALPLNGVTKMVIPVGVDYGSGGDVEFTAETEPLRQYRYMLEDRATGLFTDLGMSGYKATLPAKTYGTGRFFLHVTAGRIVRPRSGEANLTGIRIWYSNDSQINIQGEVGDGSYCEVYDTRGHKLYETRLEGGSFNSFAMPANARGVYVVKVTDGIIVTTGKVIVLHE